MTASPRPRLWWVGTIAAAVLGIVLLIAVWAKMLDPAAFAEQIRTEKLDFLFPAGTLALLALALEAAFGLALLLGVRRLWVLVPAVFLVTFFLFLTGRAWWQSAHGLRDAAASCGCFGNLVQRTPAQAFWQDLLLLVPPLLLAFVGRPRQTSQAPHVSPHVSTIPPVRTALVALGAVAVALFAWKSPQLPLDDLATRLHPGVRVDGLCAGSGKSSVCLSTVAGGLQQGDHLVVIADISKVADGADPSLASTVESLNSAAGNPEGPKIWLLTAATPEQLTAFNWTLGPVFQVVEAPPELLRPLYRSLPRSFRVKDGRVTETYAGLPPPTQLAAARNPA